MSTHNKPFINIRKKITLNYPKSTLDELLHSDSRTSSKQRGKRAISVRATEVLLYLGTHLHCISGIRQTGW